MSTNNLRIIYQNLVDSANIIPSSTASAATGVNNLKKDTKSLVWRSGTSSTTAVKANLVVTFTQAIIGGVLLPFCNLSSTAIIRVRGYIGNAPTLGGTIDSPTTLSTGTLVFDSGNISAAPYQPLGMWNWGSLPLGVNSYSYGGGTYGRLWFPNQLSCSSLLIEIVDTNPDKYIEVSRLVVGAYWSPKFNTGFGLSSTYTDQSTHNRSESGDLITTIGIRTKSLNFDLNWLTPEDRLQFSRIVKGNGMPKPIFISLFPDCSEDWDKEQTHQIYGKLSQLSNLQHPMFGMYSTSIEIEEI